MAVSATRAQAAENRLLAALSLEEWERLLPLMQMVPLKRNQMIHFSGEAIGTIYFPVTAVLALVSVLEDGTSTGLATIGRGGMAGVPVLLGATSTPFEMLVQVPGMAYRMRAVALDDAISHHPTLDRILHLYVLAFLDQVAQGIACSCHHTVRQRMACWLLTMCDDLGSDQIPMTHEFLGQMLGVGRPSVTLTAAALQEDGLIHYRRGVITIPNGAELEAAACECYRLLRDEYDHLFGESEGLVPKPRASHAWLARA